MKRTHKLLLVALLFVSLTNVAFAQKKWTWKSYGMTLTLPADFKVTKNVADEFLATNNFTEFKLYPFKDASVTAANIKEATVEAFSELGATEPEGDEFDFNGFEGAIVTGKLEGKQIIFCGFIDPKSSTNFFATLVLSDEAGEDEAVKILKTIKKI